MKATEQQKLYIGLIQKAWEDEKFKKDLLENSLQTIESFTGEELYLKDGQKILVEDQTDESVIYFNIPRKMSFEDVELSEEQLEAVSGGGFFDFLNFFFFSRI